MPGVVTAAGARPVEAFDRWLDDARAGERLVYAWGDVPQRHAPVWGAAAQAERDGLVRLHHARRAGGGWDYVAVRAVPPIVMARAARSRPVVDDDDPTEIMMRALRRAANFERPCPTNADLARVCGLRDAIAASYRLRQLRDAGRITIREQGPGLPRIVTIVATGKRTAGGAA